LQVHPADPDHRLCLHESLYLGRYIYIFQYVDSVFGVAGTDIDMDTPWLQRLAALSLNSHAAAWGCHYLTRGCTSAICKPTLDKQVA
jgi:hypothetical protein